MASLDTMFQQQRWELDLLDSATIAAAADENPFFTDGTFFSDDGPVQLAPHKSKVLPSSDFTTTTTKGGDIFASELLTTTQLELEKKKLTEEDDFFSSEIESLFQTTSDFGANGMNIGFFEKRNSLRSEVLDSDNRKALLSKIQKPTKPSSTKKEKINNASAETTTKKLRCPFDKCGKSFANKKLLRKHGLTHRMKRFQCHHEGCNKTFYERAKLKRHFIVHTGEKSFLCTICNKSFGYKANLKTHMRTHTGEKPYQCTVPGCTRRFAQASNRNAHIATHQKHKKRTSSRSVNSEPKRSKTMKDAKVKVELENSKKKKKEKEPTSKASVKNSDSGMMLLI